MCLSAVDWHCHLKKTKQNTKPNNYDILIKFVLELETLISPPDFFVWLFFVYFCLFGCFFFALAAFLSSGQYTSFSFDELSIFN